MAKAKSSGESQKNLAIRGTIGAVTLTATATAMANTWSVVVNADLLPSGGETVHTAPSQFPMAYVSFNGTSPTPMQLNQHSGTTYRATGTVISANKPNRVRVEAKFLGPVVPKEVTNP